MPDEPKARALQLANAEENAPAPEQPAAYYDDLSILDRLHVVACLLAPFSDTTRTDAAFFAVGDEERVLDEGYRILQHVVVAIDEALKALGDMRDYHHPIVECLVPLQWSVHSLSEAWIICDPIDHPLPENPAEILDFCFGQVREVARRFHDALLSARGA
jgi:hypothetical protein